MKILIPVAEGAEDMETVILADVFRRAGWAVALVGLVPGPVVCARRVRLLPDADWAAVDPDSFDMIVLPGGMGGVERLRRHAGLRDALRCAASVGKRTGAICAGPLVLYDAGLLDGRRATCFPGLEAGLDRTHWRADRVVRDGAIWTSQGPGTCFDFALALIRDVEGSATAAKIAAAMVHVEPAD